MTIITTEPMQAGRDLDALIEVTVMERHWAVVGLPPYYSTDLAAAWTVVEKLHPRLWFRLQTGRSDVPESFGCTVYFGEYADTRPLGSATERTVPHAICRAALTAISALAAVEASR